MEIAVITQKVDVRDDVLGFFHDWIIELASRIRQVHVITVFKGRVRARENIHYYSLGKETGNNKIARLFLFYKRARALLSGQRIDVVFAHMCPVYVLLIKPLAFIRRIPIVLWYSHKNAGFLLWLAEKMAHTVLTLSPDSFRIPSRKVVYTGHGINLENFRARPYTPGRIKEILSVGRIAPVKRYEILIKAVHILVSQSGIKDVRVRIAGGVVKSAHGAYFKKLRDMVDDRGLRAHVIFTGKVPFGSISRLYRSCAVLVNMAPTGAIDKVILEAMASGRPVLACNSALRKELGRYAKELLFCENDHAGLAEKLRSVLELDRKKYSAMGRYLRGRVEQYHDLAILGKKLAGLFDRIRISRERCD